MMRKVLKNAAVGATSSSVAVLLLFLAIRRIAIDVPYVWSCAMLAAICYGWLAAGLSIYGKASNTRYKWKNGLLGIAIL